MATPNADSYLEARKLRQGGATIVYWRNGLERVAELDFASAEQCSDEAAAREVTIRQMVTTYFPPKSGPPS
jgi:hypothetical protein